MNSGVRIIELQELDQNKRLLAGQRGMYSTAKRYDAANRWVSLALPVAMLAYWRKTSITARSLPSAMERHTLSKDEESLKRNQDSIFEYRSSGFLVPDWFYERFKDIDNEKSL